MTRDEFLAYIADFNSRDPARMAVHFAPDLIFENFGARHAGSDAFAFLAELGATVATTMTPRAILVDDGRVAMEADMTVAARRDAPDLPIGAMRAGEIRTMRVFAFYDSDGARIRHIRLAGWPPD